MSDTSTAGTDADAESGAEERLFGGYAGRLLVVTSIGWMTIQTGRLVISPMLPSLIDALDITPFLAGVGLSLMWGLYALNQYPSGRLSDRFSRKTLLLAGLTFQITGFGLFVGATTFHRYLLASAVVGVGAGLFTTPARALVSDHFVTKRGRALGFHTGLGDVGGLVASGLAVVVLAVATWHAAFVPVVGVLFVVMVLLYRWSDEPRAGADVDRSTLLAGVREAGRTIRRLLSEWQFRLILAAYSLYAFTWQSSASFLPTFLQETHGFSPALASASFAAMFVVGGVVKPLSGGLGDRLHKVVVAAAALVLGASSLAVVVFAPSETWTFVGVGGFAVGLLAYPPVIQAYLMDTFPNASVGGDLGATRTVYITVGALGPSYTGYVAGRATYTLAFLGLVGCLFVSAALVLLSLRFED